MSTKKQLVRYSALGASIALLLVGCGRDLQIAQPELSPGQATTFTHAPDGYCFTNRNPIDEYTVSYGISSDNSHHWISDLPSLETVESTADGTWEAPLIAPQQPGPYAVFSTCETPDSASYISWQYFRVLQPELNLSLSENEVEQGDSITAEATWCQAENDYGYEDLISGNPVMTFLLNGAEVASVEADDLTPTGTVTADITLADAGDHEITAICNYPGVDVAEENIPSFTNAEYDVEEYFSAAEGQMEQSENVLVLPVEEGPETTEPVVIPDEDNPDNDPIVTPDSDEPAAQAVVKTPAFAG